MKDKLEVINSKDIDAKEYNIEPAKAISITNAFQVKEIERNGYVKVYEGIIAQQITPELCDEAGKLRRDLVKVRTGIDAVHKVEKAYFLAAGRFCDAIKNKLTLSVEQMEENLATIENHFINQEKERKAKLKEARITELSQFPDFNTAFCDLENMDEESYQAILKEQAEFKQLREDKAKKEAEETERLERVKQLGDARKMETAQYAAFIPGYASMSFGDIPEAEYKAMLRDWAISKMEHEDKQKEIEEENKRLAIQNKEIADKAAAEKEAADKKLKEQEEKAAKEKADADAQIKALQEEAAKKKAQEEKEAADKKATEDAKKQADAEAAKAPRKTKLTTWVDGIHTNTPQAIEDDELVKVINAKHEAFKKWAKEEINKI